MKKIFLITGLLLPLIANCQNWQWARQVGGNATQSYDNGHVITDGANYYLYGTFSGTMILQTNTFTSNGNSDFYIIKYDPDGNELWAKAFGGNNGANQFESIQCAYDSSSSTIYLSGSFWNNMLLGTFTLHGNEYYNNFIARMDLNGNFIWAKNAWTKNTFSLTNEDSPPSLYVRADGLIYLNANVIDTAFFDSFWVPPGGCMAKYDSNGNCIFLRHLFTLSPGTQGGGGINFMNNDLIFSGSFKQTFTIDTATLVSNGDYDMFIARADSDGNILWIRQFGYSSIDVITFIDLDNSKNLYIAAGFKDSTSINGNIFYNSNPDILILKLDSSGNFVWGRQAFATGNIESANSIVSDAEGNCYVAGTFSGSATFGSSTISTSNLFDMFLTRYDSSGDCKGIEHFGKANCASVVINNAGLPVVAGTFANTVIIGSNTFTSSGPFDIYIAKHDEMTKIRELERGSNNQLIIYANPNQGKCNITVPDDFLKEKKLVLSIFDNSGKLIQEKTLEMNDEKIKLNLETEAKGIYNVSLSSKYKTYQGKIIFE